ncbi:type II toxin-antitoxin system Phd/YefM family antitoxin [Synechococcus sp. CS-1328]|uniref:type II toxin-antitoxin system Phd/YefM family antitoxin n=1 Tax=Synechococcus sp. CS-1328 TaxID=2847976 RepID=UPI00223C3A84|nr:type II toxin-antitoxin system prevent-host-death family antitoxin [Synechococcus sp. CS-1328]MCT0225750.1 type II toxin-antitoxin system prevent-host-death family antitoxin [Synechococcus sp. CS-1328]
MRTVTLAAAKARLSALLDAVEAGEEVVITRRGKTVARLVPDQGSRVDPSIAWSARLRCFQQGQTNLQASAVDLVRVVREDS